MINKKLTLDTISSENRSLETVIERFGFNKNFWNKSIEDICIEKDLDPDFVVQILNVFDGSQDFPKEALSGFSLELLLGYLKNTHQYYLDKKLPETEQTILALKKHFRDESSLIMLTDLFLNYKNELIEHIGNEEEFLFPYIESLMGLKEGKIDATTFKNKFKNYSIAKFTSEHHDTEDQLAEVRKIIVDYSKQSANILPFNIFINQLLAFEQDLYKHAMVEDLVVIPKALELEKNL